MSTRSIGQYQDQQLRQCSRISVVRFRLSVFCTSAEEARCEDETHANGIYNVVNACTDLRS